jgi:hypothetical protein
MLLINEDDFNDLAYLISWNFFWERSWINIINTKIESIENTNTKIKLILIKLSLFFSFVVKTFKSTILRNTKEALKMESRSFWKLSW